VEEQQHCGEQPCIQTGDQRTTQTIEHRREHHYGNKQGHHWAGPPSRQDNHPRYRDKINPNQQWMSERHAGNRLDSHRHYDGD
jgi:hypothetical protein